MIDLLERADPAIGQQADRERLRGMIEERIGIAAPLTKPRTPTRFAWVVAIAVGALVVVLALPALLRQDSTAPFGPTISTGDLPGLEQAIPLASGGVQTVAVDGDTIWAVTALAHQLQRISASAGAVEATYDIGAYVEGIKVGGGYLWLLSYDNGGEVLRFDPEVGVIDKTIPLGAAPWFGTDWFADRLWVSTNGEIVVNCHGQTSTREAGQVPADSATIVFPRSLGEPFLTEPFARHLAILAIR